MSAGNRSVLGIIDSRKLTDRLSSDHTVFAALKHFGIPCEVLDGGDYMGAVPEYIAPRALYIIAHDGAAEWLKPETAARIADTVKQGAGLICFDRRLDEWPSDLRGLLPTDVGHARVGTLNTAEQPSFITHGHEPGAELELEQEIAVVTLPSSEGWQPLVTSGDGHAVIASGAAGEGRVVLFGAGEQLYAEGVYGHVRGIDGLMWRSVVWAAAKPFPMRCVPPYVTARMDDCNGTWNAFDYVRVMNRYGIGPNLGSFIDEMGPTDWAAARDGPADTPEADLRAAVEAWQRLVEEYRLAVIDASLPLVEQQEVVREIIRPHLEGALMAESNPWRKVLAAEGLSGRYLDSLARTGER